MKDKELITELQNMRMRMRLGVLRDNIRSRDEIAGEYAGDVMSFMTNILSRISKEKVDK
ncbi:hypothetical protein [Leuconostoc citreum]|uniref:hypothetical protein n=1 Tax=Leuconostoc citreum TaxID=33964 RepID=UPI0010D62794|nr:hypothetical protein [Leuconostoc citreum]TDG65334.1 hypothetical protein C5L21_000537 [Leuconostoc citreum]GDZ85347.1 hypothetical protein LCTS_05460 [Leuconostoc citreum]